MKFWSGLLFLLLLAAGGFVAAEDGETEKNAEELEVETLVSYNKFFLLWTVSPGERTRSSFSFPPPPALSVS